MEPVVLYNAKYLLVVSSQMRVSVRYVCFSFLQKFGNGPGCVIEYSIKNLETFNITIFL